MSDEQQEEAPRGPGWINPEIQQHVRWRAGDIVVSVPGKSGTTWTMNIVHQLRSGGDADFEDIYVEVPWLEYVDRPGRSIADSVAAIDAMPTDRRRAFKSHAAPPQLPYRDEVKYVVVVRNPEEAMTSLKPFIERHSPELFAAWGVDPAHFMHPDFASFYEAVAVNMLPGFFTFTAEWWSRRGQDNVILLHFADLVREPEANIRRLADFLGFAPTAEQWPGILEYSSFAWMKQHQHKFELQKVSPYPVLTPGGMIRKGAVGRAHEDGMSPEIAADVAARGRELLPDEAAFEWLYRGGALA